MAVPLSPLPASTEGLPYRLMCDDFTGPVNWLPLQLPEAYTDLDPTLLGRVEELIDFVTLDGQLRIRSAADQVGCAFGPLGNGVIARSAYTETGGLRVRSR